MREFAKWLVTELTYKNQQSTFIQPHRRYKRRKQPIYSNKKMKYLRRNTTKYAQFMWKKNFTNATKKT